MKVKYNNEDGDNDVNNNNNNNNVTNSIYTKSKALLHCSSVHWQTGIYSSVLCGPGAGQVEATFRALW
jgi:hypothetical protein